MVSSQQDTGEQQGELGEDVIFKCVVRRSSEMCSVELFCTKAKEQRPGLTAAHGFDVAEGDVGEEATLGDPGNADEDVVI